MIRLLAAANLAGAALLGLLFAVMISSPRPDVAIDRASRGNLVLLFGPVYPFVMMGSLISPIVVRALTLLLLVLLIAAGVGLWRGERWAVRLELVLLAIGGSCLFSSSVIMLLFWPAITLVYVLLAIAMGVAAWHLARPLASPLRFTMIVVAAVACGLLVFGAAAAYMVKGLAGLR